MVMGTVVVWMVALGGGVGGGGGVGVGEVEAVGGVVEPEVGGLADEGFAGWRGGLGSGTHVDFVGLLSSSPGMQCRGLSQNR